MESSSLVLIVTLLAGAVSVTVLLVQSVIEDSRIIYALLTGKLALVLLAKQGTNGAMFVGALFALAVLALMARVVFLNIRQPRFWGPTLGIVAAVSLGAL